MLGNYGGQNLTPETGIRKVDLVIAPKNFSNLYFEFKHNLLHRNQIRWIRKNSQSADKQLGDIQAKECYYIHFIHALECDDANASYVVEYNQRVGNSYKKFQTLIDLQNLMPKVLDILGPFSLKFPIRQEKYPGLKANLYCWIARLKNEERIPISYNDK